MQGKRGLSWTVIVALLISLIFLVVFISSAVANNPLEYAKFLPTWSTNYEQSPLPAGVDRAEDEAISKECHLIGWIDPETSKMHVLGGDYVEERPLVIAGDDILIGERDIGDVREEDGKYIISFDEEEILRSGEDNALNNFILDSEGAEVFSTQGAEGEFVCQSYAVDPEPNPEPEPTPAPVSLNELSVDEKHLVEVIRRAEKDKVTNGEVMKGCSYGTDENLVNYAQWIDYYSGENNVPPLLLLAIFIQESNCVQTAGSLAVGLGQITSGTFSDVCQGTLYGLVLNTHSDVKGASNAQENIACSAAILRSKYSSSSRTYKCSAFSSGKLDEPAINEVYSGWTYAVRGYNGWGCAGKKRNGDLIWADHEYVHRIQTIEQQLESFVPVEVARG